MISSGPLVSIITPVYNSQNQILDTIASVQRQTYQNWEHIIIDDGSEDQTYNVLLNAQEKDDRIRVIRSQKNEGAAAARNEGIGMSSGRFIAFLDGDDRWLPEKLAIQVDFMLSKKHAFSYTAYYAVSGEKKLLRKIKSTATFHSILINCYIGCLTVMYDTQQLGKVYMPTYAKRQDWSTWLTILKRIRKAHGIQTPLAEYYLHPKSLSAKKSKLIKYSWIIIRSHQPNILSASCFFVLYLFVNVTKKLKELVAFRRL